MENHLNSFIAGFIAGEGHFSVQNYNTSHGRLTNNKFPFSFSISINLHERDNDILEVIQGKFGGTIHKYKSRPTMSRYDVHVSLDNYTNILSFMDEYLTHTYKLKQYNTWKEKLIMAMRYRKKRAVDNLGVDKQ